MENCLKCSNSKVCTICEANFYMMLNHSGCTKDCTTTIPKTYNFESNYTCVDDCYAADNNLKTPIDDSITCVTKCNIEGY